ncbi:putative sulfate exporter family transporter [Pseudothauera nasutitermitis]|uniref:Putative sulfate exporter family transporter n=1 Tax=Pseudothauera nasutitermitis TaxID=2565930 RepID=A0A4S4AZ23_9RHOO|nr:putative sulfate exporter family transporter [Pseudothauera nasutitermitis]THF65419.1 putative sulfate exporter family transporter [Pseudothauera nasutitermitis]
MSTRSESIDIAETDALAERSQSSAPWFFVGLALVLALGLATRFLEKNVPVWVDWGWVKSVEYPVYAIVLGLVGSGIVGVLGIREKVASAFRTEFFIKTGLVLLGASVQLHVIARAGALGVVQAVLLVSSVFFFTWWIGGKLKVGEKLRALLAASVSICGVSAAIAAAGAVRATKEQIAYTATLVILFALPSIFLLPWLAGLLGLSGPVAGAWIGGNIDTTAAVAAAGAIVGEEALQIAAIVKSAQNVLMGVVAVALTLYFALYVEKKGQDATKGASKALWERFPKFVLGFILASAVATWYVNAGGASAGISAANTLRAYFLILAFVSIGLEFRLTKLLAEGWRPIAVFGSATVFNLAIALLIASILFSNFQI